MHFKEWLKIKESSDVVRVRRNRPGSMDFHNPLASHLPPALGRVGGSVIGTVGSSISGVLRTAMSDVGQDQSSFQLMPQSYGRGNDDDEDFIFNVTIDRGQLAGDDLRTAAITQATNSAEVRQLIASGHVDPRYVVAQKEFDNGPQVTYSVRFVREPNGVPLKKPVVPATVPTAPAVAPKVVI